MTITNSPIATFKYKSNLKKKIFATILDYTLFSIPTFMFIMFFGHDNEEGGKTVSGLLALPILIFWFVYFVVIESIYGATLGHQGLDLKVLTINRQPTDWTQTLKRRLLDPIDIFIWGIPAIITVSNTDKHQRLGDLWAGTIVIDTKDSEQYSTS